MEDRPSIKQIVDLIALDYRRGRSDFYSNILIEEQSPFLESVFAKMKSYGYDYDEASSNYTIGLLRSKCQPDASHKINTVGWAKNVNRRIESATAMFYGSKDLPNVEAVHPLDVPIRPESTKDTSAAAIENGDYVRASVEIDRSLLSREFEVDYSPNKDLIKEFGLPEVLLDE